MKRLIPLLVVLGLSFMALPISAEERPDHFEGKESATLEEALENLSVYGEKLGAILEDEQLSVADMGEIHRLTYTLENALETLREEAGTMAEELEEVHLASEKGDEETIKREGQQFLRRVETLTD